MSTDTVKAWIEERQAFQKNRYANHNAWSDATRDAVMEFPYALDALQAVLELHVRDSLIRDYCSECSDFGTDDSPVMSLVEYPCPTVQAIEEAINR